MVYENFLCLMNANFDITVRMFSKFQRNYLLLMKRITLILIEWIYLWFRWENGIEDLYMLNSIFVTCYIVISYNDNRLLTSTNK